METTQMSINWWTDEHNVVCPHSGILLIHEKEQSWRVNLEKIVLNDRGQPQKATSWDSPIYVKCSKQANP